MFQLLLPLLLLNSFSSAFQLPAEFDENISGTNWAILVAGSNGWFNYRHQADVCHAYQILSQHGVRKENIITMAYDDIALNRDNMFPGKVFNDYNHKDVYHDVVIDYKTKEVTPEMFIRVLRGDPQLKKMGKKVLDSGSTDNVFIYFTDHGSDGLVAFPEGVLYAPALNDTLTFLYKENRYNKMVLYIEACNSGSMFEHILSSNIRVFATTAANPDQSSYAAFCEDEVIDTCLADEYSYNWMIDTDKNDIRRRSLQQQYDQVRVTTKKSQVMVYGDLSMVSLPVSDFQGPTPVVIEQSNDLQKPKHKKRANHAHLVTALRRMMAAETDEEHHLAKRKLHRAIELGHLVKTTMEDIVMDVEQHYQPSPSEITMATKLECFQAVFDVFQLNCFTIQQVPEVSDQLKQIHKLCGSGYKAEDMIASVHHICI